MEGTAMHFCGRAIRGEQSGRSQMEQLAPAVNGYSAVTTETLANEYASCLRRCLDLERGIPRTTSSVARIVGNPAASLPTYELDITTMQDIARIIPTILMPLIFSPE